MASTAHSENDKADVHFKMRDESVVGVDKMSNDDLHRVTSIANGQGEQWDSPYPQPNITF